MSSILRNIFRTRSFDIDDWVFKLHYRVTVTILLVIAFCLALKQFISDPISCYGGYDVVNGDALNNYCWTTDVYQLYQPTGKADIDYQREEVFHGKIYRWIVIFLVFEAFLFYLPHLLWKNIMENGIISKLCHGMDSAMAETSTVKMEQQNKRLEFMAELFLKGRNDLYMGGFFICEAFNLVIVVYQIFILNMIAEGVPGIANLNPLAVLTVDFDRRNDTLYEQFPAMILCNFQMPGAHQSEKVVCSLPLNVINEKICIFLYLWFYLLLAISVLKVIFRLIVWSSKKARNEVFNIFEPPTISYSAMNLCLQLDYGDWFFLHQLGKNLDINFYHRLVIMLKDDLKRKSGVTNSVSGVVRGNPKAPDSSDKLLLIGA